MDQCSSLEVSIMEFPLRLRVDLNVLPLGDCVVVPGTQW